MVQVVEFVLCFPFAGLCATFLIEFVILRHGPSNIEQEAWALSLVRSLFALIAAIQLLYAVCTFRYESMDVVIYSFGLENASIDPSSKLRLEHYYAGT